MTRVRFAVFAALPSLVCIGILAAACWTFGLHRTPEQRGKDLNQRAWEATFSERGLAVPSGGPRDGYWQILLNKKRQHSSLGWRELPTSVAGLLEFDDEGMQTWRSASEPRANILVIGASVGLGAYASSIESTYFNVLGRALEADGLPANIRVLASAAWKSDSELWALRLHLYDVSWDLVVFLDGLNDMCLRLPIDSPTIPVVDWRRRADHFLENMRIAVELCRSAKTPLLFVLQPSLFEKTQLSPIERELLDATLLSDPEYALSGFRDGYQLLRSGLGKMASEPGIHFFDASRLFNAETATTFSDSAHFADPGHRLLGTALATPMAEILLEVRALR